MLVEAVSVHTEPLGAELEVLIVSVATLPAKLAPLTEYEPPAEHEISQLPVSVTVDEVMVSLKVAVMEVGTAVRVLAAGLKAVMVGAVVSIV
jgi:hypothetical protein